ncbi:endonuclease NucS [Buchananella hordeovulneris]|uniref:endonuclease NucS n=1 Tax=Buchananella hordeovulneris TaxID=52770 RepID=UPI000F5E9B2E|nr:endonuclease NucS [Buchananella hordeovulneris]MDO5081709.1 endonuclease NucS [Buchananella hordeovulneris]RRD45110.1 endonuclease NucS [Buchananella hordeovulneris]RRD53078.1 endonuclease NucS [Buchananella hordeovulneris]
MRVVFADCAVTYAGRLDARLERAVRVLMLKADGSVLVHADGGSYKPLNWMSPPCTFAVEQPAADQAPEVAEVWRVRATKSDDELTIEIYEVVADVEHALGQDPGLLKDGVEAHLQELLAQQVELVAPGVSLVRREYPTAIGPVDLLVRDPAGGHIAVEVKRRGEIDGVEQLTRYLELLNRDPLLAPVRGVFAAQLIKPQARVLAADRGIACLLLDYAAMKGTDDSASRLF